MSLTREERAEIARRNGAKSRGPATQAGKAVSRANGLRNGRRATSLLNELAAAAIPECEDMPAFKRMLRASIRRLNPGNYAELTLAANIAADEWRIQRWNNVESTMIDLEFRKLEELVRKENPNATHGQILAEAAQSLASKHALVSYLDKERRRLTRSRQEALKMYKRLQAGYPGATLRKARKKASATVRVLKLQRS